MSVSRHITIPITLNPDLKVNVTTEHIKAYSNTTQTINNNPKTTKINKKTATKTQTDAKNRSLINNTAQ